MTGEFILQIGWVNVHTDGRGEENLVSLPLPDSLSSSPECGPRTVLPSPVPPLTARSSVHSHLCSQLMFFPLNFHSTFSLHYGLGILNVTRTLRQFFCVLFFLLGHKFMATRNRASFFPSNSSNVSCTWKGSYTTCCTLCNNSGAKRSLNWKSGNLSWEPKLSLNSFHLKALWLWETSLIL